MRTTASRRRRLWGVPIMHDIPSVPVTVTRIVKETPTVRTFFFGEAFYARPGQFAMVWVPGVDEVPMAFSSQSSITVQKVGDATEALFRLREGDMLGIRGPLGNGFSAFGRTLAVAGGIGAAPLLPLAREGQAETFLLGARTMDELVFRDTLPAFTDVRIATDDGTAGHHGFVTGLLAELDPAVYDAICVCGPEGMMAAVLKALDAAGLAGRGQFSLHRYMKCGVGICGSCCIDPTGLRVCRDGPVFSGNLLLKSEFGAYARDASGRKKQF
jgi:dihydroorotate dehydrogenase electron transfer subunit